MLKISDTYFIFTISITKHIGMPCKRHSKWYLSQYVVYYLSQPKTKLEDYLEYMHKYIVVRLGNLQLLQSNVTLYYYIYPFYMTVHIYFREQPTIDFCTNLMFTFVIYVKYFVN